MWSIMLLNNIHICSLDLFNFVCMFDVEIVLENAKSTIQQGLEFQIFFASSQTWRGQTRKFPSGKYSGILEKLNCHLFFEQVFTCWVLWDLFKVNNKTIENGVKYVRR